MSYVLGIRGEKHAQGGGGQKLHNEGFIFRTPLKLRFSRKSLSREGLLSLAEQVLYHPETSLRDKNPGGIAAIRACALVRM
jgi:hypothetical protein